MKTRVPVIFVAVVLLVLAACRKQEQAVVGVAQDAVNKAEQAANQAKAAAAVRDQQRAALEVISLPTKSLYKGVREPSAWMNPFLSVDAETIHLRLNAGGANAGPGGKTRAEAAARQEQEIAPGDLAKALIALPATAWKYGRVVAVAESPAASRKDRAQVRRNMEATMQQLNELGVVVEEWPSK